MEKKYNNHTFFIKTLLILHKLQYHLLKSLKRNINSSTVAAKALQNNKEKKKKKACSPGSSNKGRIHWSIVVIEQSNQKVKATFNVRKMSYV